MKNWARVLLTIIKNLLIVRLSNINRLIEHSDIDKYIRINMKL